MKEQHKHYFSQQGLLNLKKDIELVFVIGAEHKLVKKGSRFFAKCPMHQDQNHSLVISPKYNLWYCYGACHRGGSIVDWVMASQRLKLVEALAKLAELYPFLAQKGQLGQPESGSGLNTGLPDSHKLEKHQSIMMQVVGHYQHCLPENHKAIRYLRSIGVSHKAIKKHKLGYCNSTLAQALTNRIDNGDELLKSELVEAGLLQLMAEAKVKEQLHGKITMPVFDERGQLLQIYGRELPQKIKIALIQSIAG